MRYPKTLLATLGVALAAPAAAGAAELPSAAAAVMERPEFETARWSFVVQDAATGAPLLATGEDELTFTGSTAKLFSVGAALDVLGAQHRFHTPVYADGRRRGATLRGDLVLVASGDLALGGRGATEGLLSFETFDHNDANALGRADLVPESPLAGLDALARQVRKAGIRRVRGDVRVDARLWESYETRAGLVSPVVVNDNLVDVTVRPGARRGAPATAAMRPKTRAFAVRSQVRTVGAGGDTGIAIAPRGRRGLVVTGTIAADADPLTQVYEVPDPASFARTLFVEALRRAGVRVDARAVGRNDARALPRAGSYRRAARVAELVSPPLSEFAKLILKVSYNRGAQTMACLLAAREGSRDCDDGLVAMRKVTAAAGVAPNELMLIDAQGSDPTSVTPAAMVRWLGWSQTRPWGAALRAGLPVLGVDGSLAAGAPGAPPSPAQGKVQAKTGTSAALDPSTGRFYLPVKSLAGFMETPDGRRLLFSAYASGASFASFEEGLLPVNQDLMDVATAFQQGL